MNVRLPILLSDPNRQNKNLSVLLQKALSEFLQESSIVLGSGVQKFENELAHLVGTSHAVGVSNGTDALRLALSSLDLNEGDYVAMMPNAGGYAYSAVVGSKLKPLWFDCGTLGQLDAGIMQKSIEEWMTSGLKISAVVITHLYGSHGEIEEATKFLKSHNVYIVEDCAQSIGLEINGKSAGSFGDIATFSFYPTKNLGALGDAGAVATDNDLLAARVQSLRQYGWTTKYEQSLKNGSNSRLDELQARFLSLKIGFLGTYNAKRRQIVERYKVALRTPEALISCTTPNYIAHLAVIDSRIVGKERSSLEELFENHGIQTSIHYPILDFNQPAVPPEHLDNLLQYENSMGLKDSLLSIPVHAELNENEIQLIEEALGKI
jgi:aminotransferase EvaB